MENGQEAETKPKKWNLLDWWFGDQQAWDLKEDSEKRDQFKLVYDYMRLHLQLYVATPPVFALLAKNLDVASTGVAWATGTMSGFYIIAGGDAAWRIGKCINEPWRGRAYLDVLQHHAFSRRRKFLNHTFYWLGLIAAGVVAYVMR